MKEPKTGRQHDDPTPEGSQSAADPLVFPGDPGVGGLLADPQAPAVPHAHRRRPAGNASPDPEPPKAHGDWLPTHKSRGASDT